MVFVHASVRKNDNVDAVPVCAVNLHIKAEFSDEERQRMQKAFGYTYEELKTGILPMARNGAR